MSDSLDLRLLGVDVADDEARDIANLVHGVLEAEGYDHAGVAPVLNEEGDR